jgi:hypothetical protein
MNLIDEVKRDLNSYWEWLRDNTELKSVDKEWVVITTPFLNRHNDALEIFVRKEGEKYLLTDGGEIIKDLEMCGCEINKSRSVSLEVMLNGYGVKLDDNKESLILHASKEDFGKKKLRLLEAMMSVDDLFYTVSPSSLKGLFTNTVSSWLKKSKIRHIENVDFMGKSGYTHKIDFVIASYENEPERCIKSINSPNKENVQLMLFSWTDTIAARPVKSKLYAVMNDEKGIPDSVITAIEKYAEYSVTPFIWSQREMYLKELSA